MTFIQGSWNALQRVTQVHDVMIDVEALLSPWSMRLEEAVVLSDAGNLTLWLCPYPLVARVATLFSGDDAEFWGEVWQRELRVAAHLIWHNIPSVAPAAGVSAGPHRVAGTWMTLWDYAKPLEPPPRQHRRGRYGSGPYARDGGLSREIASLESVDARGGGGATASPDCDPRYPGGRRRQGGRLSTLRNG